MTAFPKYRVVPPSRHYPGLTELQTPCGRFIVAMGVGEAAERVLQAKASRT
jgi:hypothetical protein